MKNLIFGVITFFIVVVIMFTTGEILFRIFRGSPNPLANVTQQKMDYLFEPNSIMDGKSSIEGEFSYTAHMNSLGYRGNDFKVEKDPDKMRILVIGDSFTFGVGAEDNQTIPALIEQKLKKDHYNVEVINAGIGHTSPITHYLNLKNLHLKLKPDLVLLLFDMTDLWDDWNTETHAIYDSTGEITHFDGTFINGKRSLWRTALLHSAFCKWINNKIVRTIQKIIELGPKKYIEAKIHDKKKSKAVIINDPSTSDETVIQYDGLLMMRGHAREELIKKHWKLSENYLLKIKTLLDKNEIPMILVSYPHGIYVGANEWEEGRKTWGFETDKVYTDYLPFEILENFAQQNQIPYIGTLTSFLNQPPDNEPFFYNWDGHMTPKGYETVADAIYRHFIFRNQIKNQTPVSVSQ